jgi:hypothetical protein
MPSFSMASARARMPRPEVFSERKSSSMMMTEKWKRMGFNPQGSGDPPRRVEE